MQEADRALADAGAVEEQLAAIRDGRFADLLVIVIGLAAERRPDALRRAFSTVFDLKAVEEQSTRMMTVVNRTEQMAREALGEIDGIVKDLEGRVEAIDQRLDRGARALTELAKRFNTLAADEARRQVGRPTGVKR